MTSSFLLTGARGKGEAGHQVVNRCKYGALAWEEKNTVSVSKTVLHLIRIFSWKRFRYSKLFSARQLREGRVSPCLAGCSSLNLLRILETKSAAAPEELCCLGMSAC